MGFLRPTQDDEGCDVECGLCGRVNLFGKCLHCGGPARKCCGCEADATELHILESHENGRTTHDAIFMCSHCTEAAYEQQADNAKTGMP